MDVRAGAIYSHCGNKTGGVMPSIKLSVTVRSTLARKYSAASLAAIQQAISAWIAADKTRGITTVHVALDDAVAMAAQGVKAVKGKVTAVRAKKAVDALAKKLAPDYIVILGGDDVLPYFHVKNPSFDPKGDTDPTVPTDNPYACSGPYRPGSLKSYLVPDRVVGRIPDLPASAGAGDPAWIVAFLKTATKWKAKPRSFYAAAYGTCCDQWKDAGLATMRYLELPEADLMISPPTGDASVTARKRLARPLHFTKAHGSEIDAHFYGQKGQSYPEVLFSATVASHAGAGTLVGAMCCYGAQVYSPADPAATPPGALPISLSYLRTGATGFVGATKIAWVGPQEMMCADWIVASYLKKSLDGSSTGRALLEAKQDYLQYLVKQGMNPDTADEKTMIEFVLLGDPALHPIKGGVPSAAPAPAKKAAKATKAAKKKDVATFARAAALRSERRMARAVIAVQVDSALPRREPARAPRAETARRLFEAAAGLLEKVDIAKLDPADAKASRLVAPPASAGVPKSLRAAVAASRGTTSRGHSIEYTWTGRKVVKNHVQISLLKVHADARGNVLRSRLLLSS